MIRIETFEKCFPLLAGGKRRRFAKASIMSRADHVNCIFSDRFTKKLKKFSEQLFTNRNV
jgi:hypothetical protein